jgi:hypothetical protein
MVAAGCCSAGKEITEEEGVNSLMPSPTIWLKLLARRRECVPNDDIIQNDCGCVGVDAQSLLVSSTSAA